MMNCDPKAFAKCPTRHLCGTPEDATFAAGSECDQFNQQILHQPMTNADRIREMDDEELAIFLNKIVVCHNLKKEGYCPNCPLHGAKPCDTEGVLQWLRQFAGKEA